VLYAPDYVINAGGIIDIAYQRSGEGDKALKAHIESVGATLTSIFERADESGYSTEVVADQIAEERFKK
jgi:leucine dehydrogenase